eukprot:UN33912
MDRCCRLVPNNSEYLCEHGNQLLLQHKYQQAIDHFWKAVELDETNVHALLGSVKCKVLKGDYKEAQTQYNFVESIHKGNTLYESAELSCLGALISIHQNEKPDKIYNYLTDALEYCVEINIHKRDWMFFATYNVTDMVWLAEKLMKYVPAEPITKEERIPILLDNLSDFLNTLIREVPRLETIQFYGSKVAYLKKRYHFSRKFTEQRRT